MSSFNEIMQSAVEQMSSFFENQLDSAKKSLNQYDEHVNAACILKETEINELCCDALENFKYKCEEYRNDFDKQVNNRIEESRKYLKEKQNSFDV